MTKPFSTGHFLLLGLLLLFSSPGLSQTDHSTAETALDKVFTQLKKAATHTTTLYGRFSQEKHLEIFSETLLSQGILAYQAPDFLRWELLTPIGSGFILRGDHGELWNGLSKEKSNFNVNHDPIMGKIAQQLMAWARVDLDWLQHRYRIELKTIEPVQLDLYPLDSGEAGFIDHMQILFSSDKQHVETVNVIEPSGDSTLLRFEDVQINQKLSADLFKSPQY